MKYYSVHIKLDSAEDVGSMVLTLVGAEDIDEAGDLAELLVDHYNDMGVGYCKLSLVSELPFPEGTVLDEGDYWSRNDLENLWSDDEEEEDD